MPTPAASRPDGPGLFALALALGLGLGATSLFTSCSSNQGDPDGGTVCSSDTECAGSAEGDFCDPELGVCVSCLVETDCTLDDGDPCTATACVEGACVLQRRTPAMKRLGAIVPPTGALALEYSGGRLLVAEGSAGVGEYRVTVADGSTTIEERVRYPTTGSAERVRALSGHVLVAEGDTGLEVFPDGVTTAESLYLGPDRIVGMAMIDTVVIAFAYSKGLDFVDYATWTAPAPLITVDTRGRAVDAIGWNDLILVADGLAGVASIDNSDPATPVLQPTALIRTEGRVVSLRRRGDLLALAESGAGAGLFDLGAPDGPQRLAALDLGGPVVDIDFLSSNTVIFAATDGGLTLLDLLDLENISVWIREVPEGPVLDLDRSGEEIAIAMGASGVAIYDLDCTPPATDAGP